MSKISEHSAEMNRDEIHHREFLKFMEELHPSPLRKVIVLLPHFPQDFYGASRRL
jgi:hypothetical protein